jgi:hypothetical protein
VKEWFEEVLGQMGPDPETEGYLLGRGARPESIRELRLRTWEPPDRGWSADPSWQRFGREGRGEHLAGMLVAPLWSARGQLLGADFRSIRGEKQLLRYKLPEVRTAGDKPKSWVAFFVGMLPRVARALWEGAELWIVEGLFDLLALQWVVLPGQQVLACGRAALDADQVTLLRRLCSQGRLGLPRAAQGRVYVALDMDKAGRRGALGWRDDAGVHHRGIRDNLQELKLFAQVVTYLGKDPGDLWDRGGVRELKRSFHLEKKGRF